FRVCRNWKGKSWTAIQLTRIRIAKRTARRCILYRKEIHEIVNRSDEFESLNRISLHWQQNRLAADGRIELESLGRDHAAPHQHLARTAQDIFGRGQVANSPVRRAKARQADSIALFFTFGVSRVAVWLADRPEPCIVLPTTGMTI